MEKRGLGGHMAGRAKSIGQWKEAFSHRAASISTLLPNSSTVFRGLITFVTPYANKT
jgi:hypothetical protein